MTGLAGGASAIGKHQSGVNAASARNSANAKAYERDLQIFKTEEQGKLSAWNTKRASYARELRASNNALGRAYAKEQVKMNEVFDKAAFQNQSAFLALADAQGKIASGKIANGRTKARIDASALAAYGRNQAIKAEKLSSSSLAMEAKNEDSRLKAQGHNNKLYGEVTFAPTTGTAPIKPEMDSGPSPLSLIGDLASTGLSTYGAYQDSLKLPDGTSK